MDRILGFDKQTFFCLIIQLFNISFLCFIISKILYKPVLKFLKDRKIKIENSIKEAEESLIEAKNMKSFYEEKLNNINKERIRIIEGAKTRALELENKIIQQAKEEAKKIKDRAIENIKLERQNAVNDMKNQIIDISSLIAQKYINSKIINDEEMQNKLIDEAIESLEDVTWIS